jgi:2-polyprenyl-3-methyl-5-hydroxy-6-metoxy-1,4-benzoquinol methylase
MVAHFARAARKRLRRLLAPHEVNRMTNTAEAYPPGMLPFTAHRVELSPGVWTTPEWGDDPLLAPSTKILLDRAGGSFRGKRVLDVGCLEGGYAAAFARLGAREALGIEIRDSNLERCLFLKEQLRLDNLTFRKGNAKEISRETLGAFDIVFAAGLLYHLDDPFDFVRRAHEVTDDLLLLDTHVAVPHAWAHACADRMTARVWGGRSYAGREMTEYPPDLSADELDERRWSSHGNPTSFWLTEESLVDALWDVGFPYVSKVYMKRPYRDPEKCTWECRLIVVAKKSWPPS